MRAVVSVISTASGLHRTEIHTYTFEPTTLGRAPKIH